METHWKDPAAYGFCLAVQLRTQSIVLLTTVTENKHDALGVVHLSA